VEDPLLEGVFLLTSDTPLPLFSLSSLIVSGKTCVSMIHFFRRSFHKVPLNRPASPLTISSSSLWPPPHSCLPSRLVLHFTPSFLKFGIVKCLLSFLTVLEVLNLCREALFYLDPHFEIWKPPADQFSQHVVFPLLRTPQLSVPIKASASAAATRSLTDHYSGRLESPPDLRRTPVSLRIHPFIQWISMLQRLPFSGHFSLEREFSFLFY